MFSGLIYSHASDVCCLKTQVTHTFLYTPYFSNRLHFPLSVSPPPAMTHMYFCPCLSARPMKAGTTFFIWLLHPWSLEQCLEYHRSSRSICCLLSRPRAPCYVLKPAQIALLTAVMYQPCLLGSGTGSWSWHLLATGVRWGLAAQCRFVGRSRVPLSRRDSAWGENICKWE